MSGTGKKGEKAKASKRAPARKSAPARKAAPAKRAATGKKSAQAGKGRAEPAAAGKPAAEAASAEETPPEAMPAVEPAAEAESDVRPTADAAPARKAPGESVPAVEVVADPVAALGWDDPEPAAGGTAGRRAWDDAVWTEDAAEDAPEVTDPLAEFFVGSDEISDMRPVGLAAAMVGTDEDGPGEAPSLDHDYLSFFLADEEYAVPITALREIVRPLPIAPVPRTPAYVLGVVTLRGTVLPVLDLRVRLGLPANEPGRSARILVVETDEGPAGILADAVAEVVRIGDEPLEPPPGALGSGADYLEGIIRRDGRMLIVLNLARALEVEAGPRRRAEGGAAR